MAFAPVWAQAADMEKNKIRQILGAALFCLVTLTQAASAQTEKTAESFIAENITKSLAILNNAALTAPQKSQQFESLLLGITDTKRIALFTLGSYAQSATPDEREAFAAAFQDYSVAVYRSYFNLFNGQTLTVTGSTLRGPDDVIVTSRMSDASGGAPLVIQFRVRSDTGKPVVTDIGFTGIWLAVSQADTFAAYLHAHGGSVSALTANVKEIAAKYK